MIFNRKDLEILYRANTEGYRASARMLTWVKAQDFTEEKECALISAYEKEMGEYMDMKLKLDLAIAATRSEKKCPNVGQKVKMKNSIGEYMDFALAKGGAV